MQELAAVHPKAGWEEPPLHVLISGPDGFSAVETSCGSHSENGVDVLTFWLGPN